MKELDFIETIKKIIPESEKYIGDDTAFLSEKGLILTQDTLVEDIHFKLTTTTPFELGYKSIAVNLSDIAASASNPKYCLISLSMPKTTEKQFVEEFYSGVKKICTEFNTDIIGGDITGAEKLTISVTAIGYTNEKLPASRKNAKENDVVFVTGVFGSSAAGLWCLENNYKNTNSEFSIKKHLMPYPRVKEAKTIRKLINSPLTLMDASDGLADALVKICSLSKVSMNINSENIPVEKNLPIIAEKANLKDLNDWILFGGEDYELVGTISKNNFDILKKHGLNLIEIGTVTKTDENCNVSITTKDKTLKINIDNLDKKAFDHFKED